MQGFAASCVVRLLIDCKNSEVEEIIARASMKKMLKS